MTWKLFKPEKNESKRAAAAESASVRVLKKHIDTLEEVNEGLSEMVSQLSKVANKRKQESTEEMLITALISIFAPNSQPKTVLHPTVPLPQTQLDTGKKYSDEELKQNLEGLAPDILQKISSAPLPLLKIQARKLYPGISDTSIDRAKVLAGELLG